MKAVKMSKAAFVREHQELTKVLKSKNPKLLKKEFNEQSEELKKVLKKDDKRTRANSKTAKVR